MRASKNMISSDMLNVFCTFLDRGIGFLSDIRRMNVGLTRAKRSMFVLGNKLSLQKSDFWRELVEDAADRGVLVDVSVCWIVLLR